MTESLAYLYSGKTLRSGNIFLFCLKTSLKSEVGPPFENQPICCPTALIATYPCMVRERMAHTPVSE